MNNRTVILEPKQWDECRREMCEDLGYIPARDQYSDYFGCISCNTSDHQICDHEIGFEFVIVFEKIEDAVAFKLRWI